MIRIHDTDVHDHSHDKVHEDTHYNIRTTT